VKVTDKMEDTFIAVAYGDHGQITANVTAGLETVLADVPDVVPFTFAGYPDNPVFLHPCGTVVDVVPGSDTEADVQDGACDCETPGPWMRIYVERQS
jgi:hypothetical protein